MSSWGRCAACNCSIPPVLGTMERFLCFYCWAHEAEEEGLREEYRRLVWLFETIKELQDCTPYDTEAWYTALQERLRIGALMRRITDLLQRGGI